MVAFFVLLIVIVFLDLKLYREIQRSRLDLQRVELLILEAQSKEDPLL